MVQIFVTGGTGLIGKHLVKRLLSEGQDLRILIRENADKNEFSIDFRPKFGESLEDFKKRYTGVDAENLFILHEYAQYLSMERDFYYIFTCTRENI